MEYFPLKTVPLSELPEICFTNAKSRYASGIITFPEKDEHLLRENFRFNAHGHAAQNLDLCNVDISLMSVPRIGLAVGSLGSIVRFGKRCSGNFNMNLFGTCKINIGSGVTSNGLNIMGSVGQLSVGDDCMFADSISIHIGDNHGVVDIATGNLLNSGRSDITISDHVWVGAGARILKSANVGKGSIIAASSVVTGKPYPPCSLIAGNPASVKRSGTSWTRSSLGKDWEGVRARFEL